MNELLSTMRFDPVGGYLLTPGIDLDTLVRNQVKTRLSVATNAHRGRQERDTAFFSGFDGLEPAVIESGRVYQSYPTMTKLLRMTGRIKPGLSHPALADFTDLNVACSRHGITPKMTMPAPATLLARIATGNEWKSYYDSLAEITDDIATAYRCLLKSLYTLGCRFVQFEDRAWAKLTYNSGIKELLQGGADIERYLNLLAACDREAIAGLPSDFITTLYVSRGNHAANLRRSGDYNLIAPKLLAETGMGGFYLDLDVDAQNEYSFLRHLPAGKKAMLGILSPVDTISDPTTFLADNLEDAARFCDIGQLGVSFCCGMTDCPAMLLPSENAYWDFIGNAVRYVEEAFNRLSIIVNHT